MTRRASPRTNKRSQKPRSPVSFDRGTWDDVEAMERFTGVKVFSVVKAAQRHELGEEITAWIASRPDPIDIVDRSVLQSSDTEYHCLTIVLFYRSNLPSGTA